MQSNNLEVYLQYLQQIPLICQLCQLEPVECLTAMCTVLLATAYFTSKQ